ncbi:uncharacterized protein LOC135823066 [Sycon ciliatum]|uniref:uncharacterized protein LOC135823066 n=1 Tax=Sycon ciliatum TaxID=27933 RepID=UPI0031F66463
MAAAKGKQSRGAWRGRSVAHHYGQPEEIVPKDFIRIQPVPTSSHDTETPQEKSKILARTSTVRMSQHPTRDDFSHANHSRRTQQMRDKGLKSRPAAPYGELGTVEMDTKALIARTLGQLHNLEKESSSESSDDDCDSLSSYSSSSSVGLRVPAEASDMSRLGLDEQLKHAQKRLDSVSLGRCLFTIVRNEEQERLKQRQEAALEESKRLRSSWNPNRDAGPAVVGAASIGAPLNTTSFVSTGGLRSASLVSRGTTPNHRAADTSNSVTFVHPEERQPLPGEIAKFDKNPEELNIDGKTDVPRIIRPTSRVAPRPEASEAATAPARTASSTKVDATAGSRSKDTKTASAVHVTSASQSSMTDRQHVATGSSDDDSDEDDEDDSSASDNTLMDATSSVQLGAFSRSTVDGMGSDYDEESVDLTYVHKYLSAICWILEGMLADNPATLSPVAESWLPGTKGNTLKARREKFQHKRSVNEKWDEFIQTPLSKASGAGHQHHKGQQRQRKSLTEPSIHLNGSVLGQAGSARTPVVQALPPFLEKAQTLAVPSNKHEKPRSQMRPGSRLPHVKSGSKGHKKLNKEEMEWFVNHISQQGQRRRMARSQSMGNQYDARGSTVELDLPPIDYKQTPVTYDAEAIRKRFSISRARRDLIVQTQLMAMERERYKTCQQKFEALMKLGPNERIWDVLRQVREGVETESAEMARRKLLMNYNWYEDLVLALPTASLTDRCCSLVITKLKHLIPTYVDLGPDKLDKKKLFGVFAQLEIWERELPPVREAINFVRNQVIFIPEKEFRSWLAKGIQEYTDQQARERRQKSAAAKAATNPVLKELIRQKQRAVTEVMTAARMI